MRPNGPAVRGMAYRGVFYEEAGDLHRALEAYEKAREFERAEIAKSLKRDDVAGRLYRRAGDPRQAAVLLRKIGKDREAAEAFLEVGYVLDAAPASWIQEISRRRQTFTRKSAVTRRRRCSSRIENITDAPEISTLWRGSF